MDDFVCNDKEEKAKLEASFLQVKGSLDQLFLKVDVIENEVKTLKQQVADLSSEKREERAKFPKFFGALDRNEYFTGRETEMENLEKGFGVINTTPNVHALAGEKGKVRGICGLGGCGKSSLAFEYAWRNMECYPGGVLVVNGESDDMLRQSVQRIHGEFIAAENVRSNQQAEPFEQVLSQTLSWLGNLRDKWLLIVDNMDQKELSPSTRRILLGQWKTKILGHILVTSRRRTEDLCEVLGLASESCFELNPWSLDESVEFLKKRTELPSSRYQDQGEIELAQELGGLPLALEQAAAYIKALKCSIQSYLQQYHVQKSTLLNVESAKPRTEIYNEARLAVQSTWLLNFSYISNVEKDQGLGKAAAFFLKIAAYLSPDEIPVEILNIGAPEIEHEDLKKRLKLPLGAVQIVDLLVKFSLFKRNTSDTLSIHRLVQETLRDNLSSEGETIQVLSSAIRMMHQTFLNCVGATDFFCNFHDRMKSGAVKDPDKLLLTTLDVPLETRRWKRLSANAAHLFVHLLGNLPLKPQFFCEESARIFCEAAFYCYSLGMESQGYRLQQFVIEIICAIKEPIRYYKGDGLLKITRILNPFVESTFFSKIILRDSENEAGKTNDEMEDAAENTAQFQIISEAIEMIEPKAKDAISRADFQTSADLYSDIVKISNCSVACGAIKDNQPHRVPLGRILCGRGIAHLKMENFEAAFDDFDASISLDIQYYRGYYWKTYALCKLVELGRLEFASRAQAAFAVLQFKFKDSKLDDIQKLKKQFPKLLNAIKCKSVSKVSELKELEEEFGVQDDFSDVSITIILAQGHYDLKKMTILGGRFYFVCLPGSPASLNCFKGLYLSQGTFLFENVNFYNPYPTSREIILDVHEDDVPTLMFGRKHRIETERTNVTGQNLSALVEAYDVHSLVIDHCEVTKTKTSGIVIKFTDSFNAEESIVSVRLSKIAMCSGTGLHIRGSTPLRHISILNNLLVGNLYGIFIDSPSPFYLEKNEVNANTLSGIVVLHTVLGNLLRNALRHNGKHGILLSDANVVMQDNDIAVNLSWGIVCTCKSNLDCNKTLFEDNLCGGLRVIFNGKGNVAVQNCEFRGRRFGPFVFPVDQLSRMEVETNQLLTGSHDSPVLFSVMCFLGGIGLTGECISELKSPVLSGCRVSDDSVRLETEAKFCSTCCKERETNNSDETVCPSCHIAIYCSQQCCDKAKLVHDPVCKSVLEANEEHFDYDVRPLYNVPTQMDHDAITAGTSFCIIATVNLTPLEPVEGALLICPQQKVWTLIDSVIIHHLIAIHGEHCRYLMMDTKAACILANFDLKSKLITVYKHRIFPLDKVSDASKWLDKTVDTFEQQGLCYMALLQSFM